MGQATLCDPEKTTPARPEGGCIYHRVCGNMTPGGGRSGNGLCDSCLDAFRHRPQHGPPEKYDVEVYLREVYDE